ncbi:hypothetical protein GOP47_0007007 [Adiantum capillus-veneris]|uniref:Uncharacterized protein n=1 Tax=Adiantum capillus-veneris TaxID=13818 RepID=A0A9D4ZIS6_ADICA|nr:hypothetical protein GOP47_0007007 [Adiantum capillus-veneris]
MGAEVFSSNYRQNKQGKQAGSRRRAEVGARVGNSGERATRERSWRVVDCSLEGDKREQKGDPTRGERLHLLSLRFAGAFAATRRASATSTSCAVPSNYNKHHIQSWHSPPSYQEMSFSCHVCVGNQERLLSWLRTPVDEGKNTSVNYRAVELKLTSIKRESTPGTSKNRTERRTSRKREANGRLGQKHCFFLLY